MMKEHATIGTKFLNEKDKEYLLNTIKERNILIEKYETDIIIKEVNKFNKILIGDNLLKLILGTNRLLRDKQ